MRRAASILAIMLALCGAAWASGSMMLLAVMDQPSSAWTPASATGVTHWFDWEHVTMSNDLVASMLDQSGSGRHGYSVGVTSKWTRINNGGIDFATGSDNAIATASNLPSYSEIGFLVVAVAAFDSYGSSAGGRLFEIPVAKASLFSVSTTMRQLWNDSVFFDASYNYFTNSTTNIISAFYSANTNAALSAFWTNGTLVATGTGKAPLASIEGMQLYLGDNQALAREMDGRIVDFGIFASTNDRQKAEGYFAHKRGLQGLLPDSHPYKGAAP